MKGVVMAFTSYLRDDNGKICAYGVSMYAEKEWCGLASVYLDEPVGVLEAVRRSISDAARLKPDGTTDIIAFGSEAAFQYWKMHERVSGHIIGTRITLRHRKPDIGMMNARTLALDAASRGSTIYEKF